jgi:hypothetical protein
MVDEHSPLPDPPKRAESTPVPEDTDQAIPLESRPSEIEPDEETYPDPEHARRLAAVRTELFRRNHPRWEPEE